MFSLAILNVVDDVVANDIVLDTIVGILGPPIGRGVERRPKCLRSGDTGSKPPGVPL